MHTQQTNQYHPNQEFSEQKLAVQTSKLVRLYQQGRNPIRAVAGVDLSIYQGEFIAIMGGSGSGKSTLMHLMAGLISPTEGDVKIDGESLSTMTDRQLTIFRRRRIGLVFQSYNLLPQLTAEENILLPIRAEGGRIAGNSEKHLAIAKRLGILDQFRQFPDTLSGGQQQRVALARALVMEPSVILADEPTGSLDTVNTKNICQLLNEFNQVDRRTIVLITHEPDVAFESKRIVVLRDGVILADQPRAMFEDAIALARWYQELVAQREPI